MAHAERGRGVLHLTAERVFAGNVQVGVHAPIDQELERLQQGALILDLVQARDVDETPRRWGRQGGQGGLHA